jgi:asparagine synthase (glutamine-hydrolysing)
MPVCGIAGIYSYHQASDTVTRAELRAIRDHMEARGPDGTGEWYSEDNRAALGHRRLSIIDLSERASQPMQSADGTVIVTFNGEIYNHTSLRTQLEAKGRVFRTSSDTEVLLHLYAMEGEEMLRDLRGMFAFAIWDAKRDGLLLARDPYGIKPLYYADNGKTIRFASQVKALLAGGRVSRDPEPAGWTGFYLLGSVPEPYTTYREVKALPAGSSLWVDGAGPRMVRPYFSIANVYRAAGDSGDRPTGQALAERAREALADSVRHHLVADRPVGAFLSSGVDSGGLVGLMCDAGAHGTQTVTLAFGEFRGQQDDEAPLAAEVAAHYEVPNTVRLVGEREFTEDLPKIIDAMDQPSIDGVNTWFVSKAARELGLKVVISGIGGDELLGGYPSFIDIPRWMRLTGSVSRVPMIGDAARSILTVARRAVKGVPPKAVGFLKYGGTYGGAYFLRRGLFMPWELPAVMDRGLAAEGLLRLDPARHAQEALSPMPNTDFGVVATLEASLYMRNQLLRDSDWASMAHGLEVRTPLVDSKLLEDMAPLALGLVGKAGKYLLAGSPNLPLPQQVTARRKSGFSTPIQHWLLRDPRVQSWRSAPLLAEKECHWLRRWAYEVAASWG